MTETRADVYSRITDQIAAAIEAGAGEFRMPWHHDGHSSSRPINLASKRTYRGVNVLALWIAADFANYSNGLWGTYRQWLAEGAQVRKSERGTTVVLWKQSTNGSDDDHAGDQERSGRRVFARAFTVFNVAQVDGYVIESLDEHTEPERFAHADAFIANLDIRTIYGGNEAYYLPGKDEVHLPNLAQFDDAAGFYGVAIHEFGHASGAKHRLDRNLTERFGSEKYAAEECVAEMTAGFILADLGIAHQPRSDHAAYISTWLKAIKSDPRAIFTAASKAQQAADWMHAQQGRSGSGMSRRFRFGVWRVPPRPRVRGGLRLRDGMRVERKALGRPPRRYAMTRTLPKLVLSSSRDIPFSQLVLSQKNVRRVKAGLSIEDLADDIYHRTLLQSLNVRAVVDDDGKETGQF